MSKMREKIQFVLGSAVAAAAGHTVAGSSDAAAAAAPTAAAAAPATTTSSSSTSGGSQANHIVKLTRKFWVAQEDVSAVMYRILQHYPLLPSTAAAAAIGSSHGLGPAGVGKAGFGTSSLSSAAPPGGLRASTPPATDCAPLLPAAAAAAAAPAAAAEDSGSTHQLPAVQQQQQQHWQSSPVLSGFTTTMHTVYFDSPALELYHGRLYLRPLTQTLKARWISHPDDELSHAAAAAAAPGSSGWAPEKVVLERKIYKEGWKGTRFKLLEQDDVITVREFGLAGNWCSILQRQQQQQPDCRVRKSESSSSSSSSSLVVLHGAV
jgi:hypothetical protein